MAIALKPPILRHSNLEVREGLVILFDERRQASSVNREFIFQNYVALRQVLGTHCIMLLTKMNDEVKRLLNDFKSKPSALPSDTNLKTRSVHVESMLDACCTIQA
jgi:hypothetical protein